MEYALSWLTFIVTFLIGYFLGQGRLNKESVKEALKEAKKVIDTSRVGAIRTPTARDVFLKQHPTLKEGMDAMAEDLKKQGL